MTPTREAVYGALFSAIQTGTAGIGIVTYSRSLKHWSDVDASSCPAIFQTQSGESITRETGQPPKRTFRAELYVYVRIPDGQDVVPASIMNPILDKIEDSMAASPVTQLNTLGGVVFNARIDGEIETDGGVLGNTMVAIVPVVITLP